MYINRAIEKEVRYASEHYPVLMVCGARRAGKSTMLQHMKEQERQYVTMDDPEACISAENDPKGFFEEYQPPLVIDEFQLVPSLLRYIKFIVDEKRRLGGENRGMIWLTGSQKFSMMKGISESLAGRCAVFDMSSLSSAELDGRDVGVFSPDHESLKARFEASAPKSANEIFGRIFTGGMPEVCTGEIGRDKFFSDYLGTYLMRDVLEYEKISGTTPFMIFLRYIALSTGQELNLNSISHELELNYATVKRWVDMLDALGIICIIQPYYNNKLKSLTKTPKMYFMDTGLCSYLCGFRSPQDIRRSTTAGALFETYVVSEIVKSYQNAGMRPDFYYYRDTEKREIDLVVEQGDRLYPIEIKLNSAPSNAARNFYVLDKTEKDVQPGTVICLSDRFLPCGKGAWAFPAYAL